MFNRERSMKSSTRSFPPPGFDSPQLDTNAAPDAASTLSVLVIELIGVQGKKREKRDGKIKVNETISFMAQSLIYEYKK